MSRLQLIPVVPGTLGGQRAQLVDARLLHAFLEVGRDFSNWIRGRIEEYGFEQGQDYLLAKSGEYSPDLGSNPRGRGQPRIDYFLTLDMAKELAMVERTPRGREARRYFIACERQLRQVQQALPAGLGSIQAMLTDAEQRAINRQAWADVSGDVSQAFHARREALTREYAASKAKAKAKGPVYLPPGYRPDWAK